MKNFSVKSALSPLPALVFALFFTTACSKESAEESSADTTATSESAKTTRFPSEVYDDPALLKQTRVLYYLNNDEGEQVIRTMSVDNSDHRFNFGFKEYLKPGANSSHQPSRSPNRRYLASAPHATDPETFRSIDYILLTDLKTGETLKVSTDGGGTPSFNWSKDSSKLYFRANVKIWEYTIPNKSLKKISDGFYGKYWFLLNDQKTILTADDSAYFFYNLETGKKISRHAYPTTGYRAEKVAWATVSPNNQYLALRHSSGNPAIRIIDVKNHKDLWFYPRKERNNLGLRDLSQAKFIDDNTLLYPDYDADNNYNTLTWLDIHSLKKIRVQPTSEEFRRIEIMPPLSK